MLQSALGHEGIYLPITFSVFVNEISLCAPVNFAIQVQLRTCTEHKTWTVKSRKLWIYINQVCIM